MFKKVLQKFFVGLAVLTSMGTLLHDTKLNKAYEVAPISHISINVASNLESLSDAASHTHVERVSSPQVFEGVPRMQPRDDNRRYYTPKRLSRSNPFFGNSNIFVPST